MVGFRRNEGLGGRQGWNGGVVERSSRSGMVSSPSYSLVYVLQRQTSTNQCNVLMLVFLVFRYLQKWER